VSNDIQKYHGQRIELLEIEHHINLDEEIQHNLVFLPKKGLCNERLVAVISLTGYSSDQPLQLFEGPEKAAIYSIIEGIRDRVSERLPFYMLPTVWVAVAALPKLSSGKLDRKTVMQWLVDMPNDVYQRAIPAKEESTSSQEPATDMEKTLRSVWAHVLNLPQDQVPLDRPFLSLGGDSISAMQVMGRCRKRNLGLGVQDILRSKSVSQLATLVQDLRDSTAIAQEKIDEPFDLTPIQSLWFSLPNQGHGHFNQSFFLEVREKTLPEDFSAAVETLVSRHSMLRARFSHSEEHGWQQRVTEDVINSYRFRHQAVSSKQEIDLMIEDSQKCLDHNEGPLFAADLFEVDGRQQAFLTAHHLVIDLVTWRLLLEELEDLLTGETLLPPALPFQNWARLQAEHAKTLPLDKVLPPANIPELDFSYWGIKHQDNTYGAAGHASFELDPALTAAFLGESHTALRTEPVELLLASLIQSWSRVFTDRPFPAIFNEGHGREPWSSEIDISRTVGWFTTGKSFDPILFNGAKHYCSISCLCGTIRGHNRDSVQGQGFQTPNPCEWSLILCSKMSNARGPGIFQIPLAHGDFFQLSWTISGKKFEAILD
jgi:hypothetical protein